MAPFLAKVTGVPGNIVAAVIVCIGLLGAFAARESGYDIFVAMVFGFIGYLMTRYGFPKVTLVLGFVLGGLAEYSFNQTLMMSDSGALILFQRPLSLGNMYGYWLSASKTQRTIASGGWRSARCVSALPFYGARRCSDALEGDMRKKVRLPGRFYSGVPNRSEHHSRAQ